MAVACERRVAAVAAPVIADDWAVNRVARETVMGLMALNEAASPCCGQRAASQHLGLRLQAHMLIQPGLWMEPQWVTLAKIVVLV